MLLTLQEFRNGAGAIFAVFYKDDMAGWIEDPFSLLGLIPLAAVIILVAAVLAELILRLMDKRAVFLTAAAELFVWIGMLLLVFLFNGGLKEKLFFNITVVRISFLPILAAALAVVSGVLWNSYKRMEGASPSHTGYNPANWQQTPSDPYMNAFDTSYYSSASSPRPNKTVFGGARRRGGAFNRMRNYPDYGDCYRWKDSVLSWWTVFWPVKLMNSFLTNKNDSYREAFETKRK